jgi:N-acetylglucosamine kinase-like BadF-type ATPase
MNGTDYYLGVDTGASKSHALVADGQGRAIGFGEAGPGNWEAVGWDGARAALADVIGRATADAGITVGEVAAAGLGLAGYDWPEDRPPHERIIRELLDPATATVLVNDAFLGLAAGTGGGWGVVVTAGTSCNCYGRSTRGEIGRVVGSSRFGEYAGAGELVWWAVQAVARAWSQRGPDTHLAGALVAAAGAVDVADLLAGLMRGRYVLAAADAPLIFDTAAAGDAVALELVRRAGRELGDLALGVIRQLDLAAASFDIVLSGRFFDGSPLVAGALAGTVHAVAPGARLVRLASPPVVGGVLLAMERAGIDPAAVRQGLIASTAALLGAG